MTRNAPSDGASKNICVYSGSANGVDPVFAAAAEELGRRIGREATASSMAAATTA